MNNTVSRALGFISRHKKAASGAARVLAVLLVFALVNSPAVVGVSATKRSLPVYSVERDGKFVALSFDAAWGNEDTEQLIEILTSHGVTATFFLVGQWVDKYPESVKQLSDAGMEVMNHSNDHAHFAKLSASEIVENINAVSYTHLDVYKRQVLWSSMVTDSTAEVSSSSSNQPVKEKPGRDGTLSSATTVPSGWDSSAYCGPPFEL